MSAVKANTWKWLAVLLLVLNGILVIVTWKNRSEDRPPDMMAGGEGPAKYIIAELNLDDRQVQEFDKLKNEHRSAVSAIQLKGRQLRDRFFNLLKTETPDTALASAMADSIAANQRAIELVTFDHFVKVRQLCNDSQKKRFDDIINEILHNMARRPPGDHGPPPPHQ